MGMIESDVTESQTVGYIPTIINVQWNSVNTVTNGSQKFGRINGVRSKFIT